MFTKTACSQKREHAKIVNKTILTNSAFEKLLGAKLAELFDRIDWLENSIPESCPDESKTGFNLQFSIPLPTGEVIRPKHTTVVQFIWAK